MFLKNVKVREQNRMLKLGVVVPVYNAEKYLDKCISSIIGQTYGNMEIVLVDDGSTDGSGTICDKYAERDSRIHVIHQKNQGKLAARYQGVKMLMCKYITFVDADDWIAKDLYEKIAVYMEQDIDVISFVITRYFSDDCIVESKDKYTVGEYGIGRLASEILPSMIWDYDRTRFGLDPSLCNKIFKRNLLLSQLRAVQKINVSYGDDMAVIYPLMLEAESLMITDCGLYYHRQRNRCEVAPYYEDDLFFDKILILYHYLKERMGDVPLFVKQLDYMLVSEIRGRLRKYGNYPKRMYLFPFNQVKANQSIILYGAGAVGQAYYKQIKELTYANIVAWVDKNCRQYEDLEVEGVEVIRNIKEYDYIVIAVENEKAACQITDNLVNEMKIERERIIWKIYYGN